MANAIVSFAPERGQDSPASSTPRKAYHEATRQLAGGVRVVTMGVAPDRTSFTATSVISLSVDSPRLIVSVKRASSCFLELERCRCFGVSIPASQHCEVAVPFRPPRCQWRLIRRVRHQFRRLAPLVQCLTCGRACRIPYGGSHFRCRRCWGLKYDSQYEPSFGLAARKAHRTRDRLGYSVDVPFPPKPKDMHWAIYRNVEVEDERLRRLLAAGA
jgi:hypothetical protein